MLCAAAFAQEKAAPAAKPNLMDPKSLNAKAPENFKAKFTTSKGDFVIEVHRAWAPRGADRFYNLVRAGFFKDIYFFRVIPGFMAQFGIPGDPAMAAVWQRANLMDDPTKESNTRGRITFATAGPNTRSTQFFINFGNNAMLDSQGFAPFGEVVEGMNVVDSIYSGYGEGAPRGRGPDQGRIQQQGNAYLKSSFPQMDRIISASIMPAAAKE